MTDREAMQKAFEIIGVLKPNNFVHRELQGKAWDALRQALAQPEPFKPDWVSYRQGVADGAAQHEQEPVAKYDSIDLHVLHSHLAGMLYDFMGWLTSRRTRLCLSDSDNASPAVAAIVDFAKMRGLNLQDAQVECWQSILTTPHSATHSADSAETFGKPEQKNYLYEYAKNLAVFIWTKHYKKESPDWKPLPDVLGVLTQIDNMTCGLEKAQPKQITIECVYETIVKWDEGGGKRSRRELARRIVALSRREHITDGTPCWCDPIGERATPEHNHLSDAMSVLADVNADLIAEAKLAQHEQEPVAWKYQEYRSAFMGNLQWFDEVQFVQPPNDSERFRNIEPLYTAPPKQWVGLTDEEVDAIRKEIFEKYKKALFVTRDVTSENDYSAFNFYRAIEEKLRIKND